jgi:sugar lactone lactonase YvrE
MIWCPPGQFNEPVGIAFDQRASVYVADTYNHRIQKFVLSR